MLDPLTPSSPEPTNVPKTSFPPAMYHRYRLLKGNDNTNTNLIVIVLHQLDPHRAALITQIGRV